MNDEEILNIERQKAHTILLEYKEKMKRECEFCSECDDVCDDCEPEYEAEESIQDEQAINRALALTRAEGAKEERERIKKEGYWTEGEGIEQIDYVIDIHSFPHLLGCEGVMCNCANRAKRKGFASVLTEEGYVWVKL